MSDSSRKAVFLSYASQDAEAAKRLCASLRSAGIEVWFDAEGGLEHGDEWDAKIRRQVKDCLLFIPLISANTQARAEGYFRIEWELAAERAVGIASGIPFLLPMVIDDIREPDALVPERFRRVQWTRVPQGVLSDAARSRLIGLHRSRLAEGPALPDDTQSRWTPARRRTRGPLWISASVLVIAVAIAGYLRFGRGAAPAATAAVAPAIAEARKEAARAIALSTEQYASQLPDYQAAERLIQNALSAAPTDPQVLGASADLNYMFWNRGFERTPERFAQAQSQAEQALALDPGNSEALFVMGCILDFQHLHERSAASFSRAIASRPDFTRAKLWLGGDLIRSGANTAEGTRLLQEVDQDSKWGPLADYFLFLNHFADRQFAEADRTTRRAFARVPAVNSLVGRMLVTISWKGDAATALSELQRDGANFADAARVVWATAVLQLDLHRPDAALETLARLSQPYVHESYFIGPVNLLRGRALVMAGRREGARTLFQAALADVLKEINNGTPDLSAHLARGEICAELGQSEEALAEAKTVQGLDLREVDSYDYNRSPARIYAILGRADLAVPLLAKALTMTRAGWPITREQLRLDPLWDPLRKDAGFQALVAQK